jgi:hypothetical protein
MTVQELLDVLNQIPEEEREREVTLGCCGGDVAGISNIEDFTSIIFIEPT